MFIKGDKVRVKNRHELKGEIVKISGMNGTYDYTVRFDAQIVPREWDFTEKEIEYYLASVKQSTSSSFGYWGEDSDTIYSNKVDKEKQCPDCIIDWTISYSPIHAEEWRDCQKCGQRYEDFK